MNWIANFVRPRIKSLIGGARSDTPENLWRKCPSCGEMIFHRDLAVAQNVCPQCGHHMRIGVADRFAACGYPTNAGWGENIAYGYRTGLDVVKGWLASPEHRANLLNCKSTQVGVGAVFAANGTPYYTQDFGY